MYLTYLVLNTFNIFCCIESVILNRTYLLVHYTLAPLHESSGTRPMKIYFHPEYCHKDMKKYRRSMSDQLVIKIKLAKRNN